MPSFLLSAALPLLLWPLEIFLPYPHIIEELAKLVIVFLIIKESNKPIKSSLLAGVLFGFSETVLYFFNILPTGNSALIIARFATTVPMHTLTIVLMTWMSLKGKVWGIFALILSITIHYFFNKFLVGVLGGIL